MSLETQSPATQECCPTYCPTCGAELQRKTKGLGIPFSKDLILQFLTKHPKEEFYHTQIALAINVGRSTVSYAIKQLHERGKVIIHRKRAGKSTRAYVQLTPKICRTPGCEKRAVSRAGFCHRCWTSGKDYFLTRKVP